MAAVLSSVLLLATSALAQNFIPTHIARQANPAPTGASALPLTEYHFTFPNVPYKVNPFPSGRGPQSGYNICNSTTEGPNSLCQTAFVNSIDDFCLWGSPTSSNGQIGDVEASVVAYCTKPGHGARVMPAGTLKSVQFMRTSAYVQVSGTLNQPGLGLAEADTGGELDPHGADLAGNPLGGLVFSNSLPSAKGVITQGENWSNFVGGGLFCMKVCDNTIKQPNYCQNIFDLIGCANNMPSDSYTRKDFTDCQGDLQMEPGLYVSNGKTLTYSQPATLTGGTLPWQPSIPPSSSCTTFTSAQLFSQAASALTTTGTQSSRSSAPTGDSSATQSDSSQTGSGARPTAATTSSAMSNSVRLGSLVAFSVAGLVMLS